MEDKENAWFYSFLPKHDGLSLDKTLRKIISPLSPLTENTPFQNNQRRTIYRSPRILLAITLPQTHPLRVVFLL